MPCRLRATNIDVLLNAHVPSLNSLTAAISSVCWPARTSAEMSKRSYSRYTKDIIKLPFESVTIEQMDHSFSIQLARYLETILHYLFCVV